jgi:hypothetical protein
VASKDNSADGFTKALDRANFDKFITKLGMVDANQKIPDSRAHGIERVLEPDYVRLESSGSV